MDAAMPRPRDDTRRATDKAIDNNSAEAEREDDPLTPSQNVHRAYNIAAAKIGPLKRLIADRKRSGVNRSALEKLLREAEREMKALEQKMSSN
jgi:hypothetical protein